MQLVPHLKTPFTLLFLVIFYLIAVCLLPSCNIINPSEQIPAYIQIDSPSVSIISSAQGTSSHRISDAWVYIDNSLQGVYEMPMTFPLLKAGTQEIVVVAGISQNGVAGTRIAYPFFYPDSFVVNLQSKETYHLKPVYSYKPGTLFLLNEDFESGNNFIKLSGDTTLIRANGSAVFEGDYCGYFKLDDSFVFGESKTAVTYPFNNNGSPVYLEMNYKCNQKFEVGVQANTTGSSIKYYNWNITPKGEWNKIYLNLTEVLQSIIPDDYNIIVRVQRDTSVAISEVFIDNIKLITLQ